MTAQILAAAAASLSGPAPIRNCIPAPVLLSLIMMIGCNAANGAFDRDLSRPRHSARKPPTEFAPPTSTANSVFCTSTLGGIGRAASAFAVSGLPAAGAAATTVGAGVGAGVAAALAAGSGVVGFPAAASGGAMIDFEAVDGAADAAAAGLFGVPCSTDTGAVGPGRGGLASATGLSAGFSTVGVTVVATAVGAGAGFGGAAGAAVATAAGMGAGAGVGAGGAAATTAFCRAIEPVTEFEPLFQDGDTGVQPVAVAVERIDRRCEPPRLVLAVPGNRLDLLLLPRQIGYRDPLLPQPDRRLAGVQRDRYRAHRDRAPGCQPQQRAAVEIILIGKKSGQHAARVLGLDAAAPMDGMFCHRNSSAPQGPPNHAANINRKCTRRWNPSIGGMPN